VVAELAICCQTTPVAWHAKSNGQRARRGGDSWRVERAGAWPFYHSANMKFEATRKIYREKHRREIKQ